MYVLDTIIGLPLLWATYKGFKKGLIVELASLVALVFGIYGAIGFSDFTSKILRENLGVNSSYNALVAFALTFIAIVVAVFFLAKLIEGVVKMAALGIVNKIAGSIFSIFKYSLILSAVIYLINSFDKRGLIFNQQLCENSILYKPIAHMAPRLFPSLKNLTQDNPIEKLIEDVKSDIPKPTHNQ